MSGDAWVSGNAFLLTHPVWDVTSSELYDVASETFLLTHPVWDVTVCDMPLSLIILIFLLTHPVWDVTVPQQLRKKPLKISTHTSRVGCDRRSPGNMLFGNDFYSHIPCGM